MATTAACLMVLLVRMTLAASSIQRMASHEKALYGPGEYKVTYEVNVSMVNEFVRTVAFKHGDQD